jgi:hypothetical protein
MKKIIKIKMKDEPHSLRGGSPDRALLFPGDPDKLPIDAGNFTALYESCLPKFTKNTGTIVVFGTGGEIN